MYNEFGEYMKHDLKINSNYKLWKSTVCLPYAELQPKKRMDCVFMMFVGDIILCSSMSSNSNDDLVDFCRMFCVSVKIILTDAQ